MRTDDIINLLKEAYRGFLNGDSAAYRADLAKARQMIDESDVEAWVEGEWILLDAMTHLREPEWLIAALDRAVERMAGRRSLIFTSSTVFGFSSDSVFWALLKNPGDADRNGALFRQVISRYNKLTGCGAGYPEFYQSELAYLRGDLANARNLAYQAVYLAQSTGQSRLMVSAAKVIACIALHNQDTVGWTFALDTVARALKQSGSEYPMLLNDIIVIRNEMLTRLNAWDELPQWQKDGNFSVTYGENPLHMNYRVVDDPNIGAYDYPQALWVHALYLLQTGQFSRALAADAVQRMFGVERELLVYQLYFCLLRGDCYLYQGDRKRAFAEFCTAAEMVKPDGLWLVLTEFVPGSDGLILEAVKTTGGDVAAVRQTARNYARNAKALKDAVSGRNIEKVLTAREAEVAKLAATGMRNREIAEKLSVTEQTIKFHLSNIYSKLNVSNRSKLVKLMQVYTENYTKVQ